MSNRTPFAIAAMLTALLASPAHPQSGGTSGTSAAVTIGLPLGSFDDIAKTGMGVALRHAFGDQAAPWSARGTFGFTYFRGRRPFDNVQFIETTFDMVHRTDETFYQFGGLGMYNTKYSFDPRDKIPGISGQRANQDIGLSAGVGVNYMWGNTKTFLEFAATTVFDGSDNRSWFPLRMGIRF